MAEKEIRSLSNNINIRSMPEGEESRTIEGYALLFESESKPLYDFTEVIRSGAITQETVNKCDVVALFDHDRSRGILARSTNGSGSLKLTVDERGLKYEFEAPNTNLGNEMLELLKRGDLRESSFAFTCKEDMWERRDHDEFTRYINEIEAIYDVSIVINPAYSGTAVKCRSYEQMKEKESTELRSYWDKLKSDIK